MGLQPLIELTQGFLFIRYRCFIFLLSISLQFCNLYPTAMSLIGLPDWFNIHDSKDLNDYGPETLGFVEVEFEFPADTRYPTLPVRTDNGLIFPLKGLSCCAAPELFVARKLGAKLTIKHGVIVPTDNSRQIFGDFIKDCINKRMNAGSKTLEGLFWKEISNSTYGKTAQGLHEKRVYDIRDREGKSLPPSKITNAYYASYISSFTRAVLGEIMNSVPANRMVFSCTTDGFICNMTDDEAVVCQQGVLSTLYATQRRLLTKDSTVLDKKHAVKRPLGWRTRGQATLDVGDVHPRQSDFHIVLAKGGIYTPPEFEEDDEQNAEIVRMFFERNPDTRIEVEAKTGVRDMVEYNADFVEKIFSKRLNMEFDWKRAPYAVTESETYGHIAFSTQPWVTNAIPPGTNAAITRPADIRPISTPLNPNIKPTIAITATTRKVVRAPPSRKENGLLMMIFKLDIRFLCLHREL